MTEEFVKNIKDNFLNKTCTVLTHPVSFQYKDPIQHAQYFSGLLVAVDKYGVWLKHLEINTYAFFSFPVIGIVEEQSVPVTDPKYKQIKEELERKKRPSQPPLIPVESLTNMIKGR